MFKSWRKDAQKMKHLFLFSIFFSFYANAAYKEECTIKYVSTGKAYQVSCTYLSGSELNSATNSFRYDTLGLYSVTFWGQGQATVIKVRGINFCGFEATRSCADSISPLNGTDQEGREWKICQPSHLFC